jgi:hypothetical protein
MKLPTSGLDRPDVEAAEPRCRLPRVENPTLRSRHSLHKLARRGCYSARPLKKVEQGALRAKDASEVSPNAPDPRARGDRRTVAYRPTDGTTTQLGDLLGVLGTGYDPTLLEFDGARSPCPCCTYDLACYVNVTVFSQSKLCHPPRVGIYVG